MAAQEFCGMLRRGEPRLRHGKDLGRRKHRRIEYQRSGFIFETPEAPWIECFILDISATGLCLEVGALPVPELFGVSFTPCGRIMRVCVRVWRRGELLGARFATAKELRLRDQKYVDPRLQKAKPAAAR
jgi:hypothetical protein